MEKEKMEKGRIRKMASAAFMVLIVSSMLLMYQTHKVVLAPLPVPLVHNINTGLNYTTIQGAIDAPQTLDGQTLQCDAGNFTENVHVYKELKIIGAGEGLTRIIPPKSNDTIDITALNVTIEGFTVQSIKSYSAIHLDRTDYCSISSNNITGNSGGITLTGSSGNTVSNNVILSQPGNGIFLTAFSQRNTIVGNSLNRNHYGIVLFNASNYNVIEDNSINSSDWSGIRLNWQGSNYAPVAFNNITDNVATNNGGEGIFLDTPSPYNLVCNNYLSANNIGVRLRTNSSIVVHNTVISNSYRGISAETSDANTIYDNFLNNTSNAWDNGVNSWNVTRHAGPNIIGGPYIGGNYWSNNPNQTDTNHDGLGDVPYNIAGGTNKDYLPLVGKVNLTSITNPQITPSSGQAKKDTFTITADYTDNIVPINPIPNFYPETCDYNKTPTYPTPSTINDEHPRLAVDSKGNVHKVWMGQLSNGLWAIFYAELIDSGPNQRVYEQISHGTSGNTTNSVYPSIALDSYDNSHVVWIDFRDGHAQIYYNRVAPTTGQCYYPKDLKISSGPLASGRAVGFNAPGQVVDGFVADYIEQPDVAVDIAGNVHIVWSDNRPAFNNFAYHWEIYYNKIYPGLSGPGTGGLQFTNDLLLTDPQVADGSLADPCWPLTGTSDNICPTIACDGFSLNIAWQKNVTVVQVSPHGTTKVYHCWEIYYQQRDAITLYSNLVTDNQFERIASHYDAVYDDNHIPKNLEINYPGGPGPGDAGSDGYNSAVPDIGVDSKDPKTVLVPAQNPASNPYFDWTDTGKFVHEGDTVDIAAYGWWACNKADSSCWCGPGGTTYGTTDGFCTAALNGELIGYIGPTPPTPGSDHLSDAQKTFPVGISHTFTAGSTQVGELWLGINDDAGTGTYYDNGGNVTAVISIRGLVEITWMDQRPTWWQGWAYPSGTGGSATQCPTPYDGYLNQYCWEVYIAVLNSMGQLSRDPCIGGLAIKRESDMTSYGGLGTYTGPLPCGILNGRDWYAMYPRMAVLSNASETHLVWQDSRDMTILAGVTWEIYYKEIPSWCKNPTPDKVASLPWHDYDNDMYPDVALEVTSTGSYIPEIKWQSKTAPPYNPPWRIYDTRKYTRIPPDPYIYVEVQPSWETYPTGVLTFDLHPMVPSQNITLGVPVTYGFTFIISTPGQYQFRICARDSAGHNCTTGWMAGPTVNPFHDVAIADIATISDAVFRGTPMPINVTVINYGSSDETSNVTLYANQKVIGTLTNVTIPVDGSITIPFTWNTRGLACGCYTISAYVAPVQGETDTADNLYVITVLIYAGHGGPGRNAVMK
jgi:parallel beta-helix repeat protein